MNRRRSSHLRPIRAWLGLCMLLAACARSAEGERPLVCFRFEGRSLRWLAFSNDSKLLAASFDDGEIRVWDWRARTELRRFRNALPWTSDLVIFSKDDRELYSRYGDGSVRVWDVAGGRCRTVSSQFRSHANETALSPDGRTLAIARQSARIELWDTQTLKFTGWFSTGAAAGEILNGIAFSPDGTTLAVSAGQGPIRLWRLDTGGYLSSIGYVTFAGMDHPVFSPNGNYFAAASGHCVLFDLKARKPIAAIDVSSCSQLLFSPDGRYLLAGCSGFIVWDISNAREAVRAYMSGCFALSSDGKFLAGTHIWKGIAVWDFEKVLQKGTLEDDTGGKPTWITESGEHHPHGFVLPEPEQPVTEVPAPETTPAPAPGPTSQRRLDGAGNSSGKAERWPLWDGQETVAAYAQRAGLAPTRTLDLGHGKSLEVVLVPAGKFVMGTSAPALPDEAGIGKKIIIGRAVLAASAGTLIVFVSTILLRATRKRRRPQYSLARLLAMTSVAGTGVLGAQHWRYGVQELERQRAEFPSTLARHRIASDDEQPAHEVTLTRPFYMGKFEVTEEQYAWTARQFRRRSPPRINLSWADAEDFCVELGRLTGLTVRLPTEAEWEYACRAGTTSTYHSGDTEAALDRVGWRSSLCGCPPRPVGQGQPNSFGLYDMHGNAIEWCQDWLGHQYYSVSPSADPQGPASGAARVLRGGAWDHDSSFCRSAARAGHDPFLPLYDAGFRIVVDLQTQP